VTFLLSMMCYIVLKYRPAVRNTVEEPKAISASHAAESIGNGDVGITSCKAPTADSTPLTDGLSASLLTTVFRRMFFARRRRRKHEWL
jgi:hypothetical protein